MLSTRARISEVALQVLLTFRLAHCYSVRRLVQAAVCVHSCVSRRALAQIRDWTLVFDGRRRILCSVMFVNEYDLASFVTHFPIPISSLRIRVYTLDGRCFNALFYLW